MEKLIVQFKSKGRKNLLSQLEGSQVGVIRSYLGRVSPFCSGLQLIG